VYDWIEDDRIVTTLTEVKRYFLSIETESNSVNVSTVMHSFMIPTDRVVMPFNNVKAHVLTAMIPPIRDAAYHKWLFLFIAIGCAVPLFTFWLGKTGRTMERKSLSSLLLCGATAVLGITAAFTGIAAWKYGQDQRLQTATATLFLCLPVATITLMVAQTWHSGMLPSLDRLASLPVFQWLSRPAEDRREKDDSHDVSHT